MKKTWEAGVNWTPEVLREWLNKNHDVSITWLSQTMGKSAGYLNRCIDRRHIAPSVLKQLATLTDIPESKYTEWDSEAVREAIDKTDVRNRINESKVSWREFHGPNKQIDLSGYDWPEEDKERFTPITQAEYDAKWESPKEEEKVSEFVRLTRKLKVDHYCMELDRSETPSETRILYVRKTEILSVEELLDGSLVTTKDGKFTVTEAPDDVMKMVG